MITFRFPTNVSLDRVVQEYVIQRDKLKGIKIMPFNSVQTVRVQWDELDNERGMTAPHNMNADPKVSERPGSKVKEYTPLYFKETDLLRESDIIMPRAFGTFGNMIDLTTEVGRVTKARVDKNYLRAEWAIWQALGGALNFNENGVKVNEVFPVQPYDVLVDWDEFDTATPLRDLNAIKLLMRGTGASIQGAVLHMNQTTCNWLLQNNNPADLKGYQNQNFQNVTYSVDDLNKILTGRGMPTIEVYDEGYHDAAGNFTLFLQDGDVRLIGKRPNMETVGDFVLTPTLHRTGPDGQPAPGFFSFIEVNGQPNPGSVSVPALGAGKNPKVEITGGFAGGPRMIFPRSVVKIRAKVT
jgi:hypothetical protein